MARNAAARSPDAVLHASTGRGRRRRRAGKRRRPGRARHAPPHRGRRSKRRCAAGRVGGDAISRRHRIGGSRAHVALNRRESPPLSFVSPYDRRHR
ncbi:MAG: hypothetical protein DMF84_05965 [Acidobacteria bacterium]|nr:MAG: hypothetical protein DMF84_05965 [Acidobacteriota bacterium]